MGDVHAVADDKQIRAFKADEIGVDPDGALAGFFEHHANHHRGRPPCREKVLGKGQGAPGFQNIVDEQDVAAGDGRIDILEDGYLASRSRRIRDSSTDA